MTTFLWTVSYKF
jgi:hypothetical protein